jgi:hypothetical protein
MRMYYHRRLYLSLSLLLVTAACGGSDVVTGPDGDPPPASPSFAQDVSTIFTAGGCTAGNCHGGGAGDLTLTSSAATNYATLVNVTSSSAPAFLRVEPNDATDSYLVMKLEGRQLSGGRMPLAGPALSSNQITTIRNWISAGALNN